MTAVTTPSPAIAVAEDGRRVRPPATVATWVFVAVLLGALPLFLVLARDQWFFLDEWDYLATRSAGNLGDLLRPHNEHWQTLPILEYRALFGVFGLRTYVPYQLLAVVAHVVVAALLWVVMRRADVHPWIATAAASLFALLGSGSQNIVWAFQVGWTASLAFGLGHLLLADHDGPMDRRDAAGLLCGAAGLLCGGVAIAMTAAVGLAVLVRRRWRAAVVHVVPLAAAFAVWWVVMARDEYGRADLDVGQMLDFGATAIGNAFSKMGQLPGVGLLLAVFLLTGLALAVGRRGLPASNRRWATPIGLLLGGAGGFLLITATGRASEFGSGAAHSSRYVYVLCAMSLPAVALGADALARRWRVLLPAAIGVFLVGIPGNVIDLAERGDGTDAVELGNPTLIRTLAVLPVGELDPARLRVPIAPGVTVAWLHSSVKSGDLEAIFPPPLIAVAAAQLIIALQQRPSQERPHECEVIRRPLSRALEAHERFFLVGGPLVVRRSDTLASTVLDPAVGSRIDVTVPVRVVMSSQDSKKPAALCASATTDRGDRGLS